MSANGHENDLPGRAPDFTAIDQAMQPRKPDGGAAFPQALDNEHAFFGCEGMTLRDFFAAKAPTMPRHAFEDLDRGTGSSALAWRARRYAAWAYTFADAMLAERDKRAEPSP